MAAVHCPVCPHVQLPLPPAPVPVPGLLRDSFCFPSGRLLAPAKHRECWGGMCPGSHGEAETDPFCYSKAGHSRLFYPLLIGSAQQFLLVLAFSNAEAMQPLASATAVPLPRCGSPSW